MGRGKGMIPLLLQFKKCVFPGWCGDTNHKTLVRIQMNHGAVWLLCKSSRTKFEPVLKSHTLYTQQVCVAGV